MRVAKVDSGVGGLDDHLLPHDGPAGEGELVAGAARRLAVVDGRKAVGQVVVDGPGGLVAACEAVAACAARGNNGRGRRVGEWVIVDVASDDGAGDARCLGAAACLATIPESVRNEAASFVGGFELTSIEW